jgi:NTP pyrophosphatase (non-canonical NTP hydrolase)
MGLLGLVSMCLLFGVLCLYLLVKVMLAHKLSYSHPIMTIEEAQKTVDTWITTVGVRYYNELTNMAILTEEVGEVARIIARRYGEQSFKDSDKEVDLADELADVLFVLICLANQTGVDLQAALQKNLDKKTQRDAVRHQNNEKLQS